MKSLLKTTGIFAAMLLMFSCGDSEKKEKDEIRLDDYKEAPAPEAKSASQDSEADSGDDLSNKGIGPIDNLSLDDDIDSDMAAKGGDIFKNMCSACHKMDKKFVGPQIAGVTERRSPEWIMNMILNPEQMIKEDPIAKRLLIESNMAVMANQGLAEDEARAILEYFRQYDEKN
ncbi:MAG: cytochrome c [Salegentibacter sp.]|uniref:Cytochrome c n=1 Tax=Salegentibacter flavus TaxID=287099 RepID=A0A1I5ADR7_9FLAO|nr:MULTISPECIES: cytochrome c [Salegentibacter]MDR9457144.1 cytochrome c [Salegentibacter sp.]SFN60606.1 Cytochrome c [Salegentibacter flavus]